MFKESITIKIDEKKKVFTGNSFGKDALLMAYGITNVIRKWHSFNTGDLEKLKEAAYRPITGALTSFSNKLSNISRTNAFLYDVISLNPEKNPDETYDIFYDPNTLKGGKLFTDNGEIYLYELYGVKVKQTLLSSLNLKEEGSVVLTKKQLEDIILPSAKLIEYVSLYEKMQNAISILENELAEYSDVSFEIKLLGDKVYLRKPNETPEKYDYTSIDISGGMVSTFSEIFGIENFSDHYIPLKKVHSEIFGLDDLKSFIYAFYQRDPGIRNPELERHIIAAYNSAKEGAEVCISIDSEIIS